MEEEILIVGVDYSTDCVCLSRKKGKTTTTKRKRPKKERVTENNEIINADKESCLVIIDDNSTESEEDYDCIEVDSGGSKVGAEDTKLCSVMEDNGDGEIRGDDSLIIPTPKRCKLPHHTNDSTTTNLLHVSTEQHSSELCLGGELLQKTIQNGSTKFQLHKPAGNPSSNVSGVTSSVPQLAATQHLQQQDQQELATLTSLKDQTVPSHDMMAAPDLTEPMSDVISKLRRTPHCWTTCPNCPPDAERKFHLIDVVMNSAEWTFVSSPLDSGFTVTRIRRIQNESLWQRLCYEKQLMLRERNNVNEQLLYHTSRSPVEVISEEGLDLRLSMNGNYGSGIYFR